MILLLVIAILVLLAVMGSVYVLMAGADRQSTNASNGNASLALAQASVLNIVRGQIGNQLTDGSGNYLNGAVPTKPYARTWDMPELGNTASSTPANPTPFYQNSTNFYRSEPWLVSLPVWMSESYFPPNTEILWTGVDPTKLQTAPAAMEIGSYASQPPATPASITGYTTVPTGFTAISPTPGVTYPPLSILSPFLYDPATGLNDIGMSYQLTGGTVVNTGAATGAQGTVYVPNASVVFPAWSNNGGINTTREGIDDSCWNLLPYSSPNGTRYRFAVRIMDENSMLNVNVGQAAVNPVNPGGEYYNGYGLAYNYDSGYYTVNAVDATTAQMTLLGVARSSGPSGPFTNYAYPSAWQRALWTRDVGGIDSVDGTNSAALSLFGAGSTLAVQSFQGSIPTGIAAGAGPTPFADCRLGFTLANTFGFNPTFGGSYSNGGQPWKMFFTAYSKDRPLRTEPDWPVASAPYGLISSNPYSVNGVNWQEWPQSPGKIFVNAPADSPALVPGSSNSNATPPDLTGGVALTAAQIGQAMVEAGYSGPQALGFAANYMTYRMGVAQGLNSSGALATTGPSFIDYKGVNIRGIGLTPAAAATIANFDPAHAGLLQPDLDIVAGIAAQPFINEVAVVATNKTGAIAFTNYAVELFNPFESPIDLSGWQLAILNPGSHAYVGAAYPLPSGTTISAHGFLVIEQSSTGFNSPPPGVPTLSDSSLSFSSAALNSIVLTRPFAPDGSTTATAQLPVDEFSDQGLISTTNIPSGKSTPTPYSLQRPNDAAFGQPGIWACEDGNAVFSTVPTLGAVNNVSATGMPAIPLFDRFYDPLECTGYYSTGNPSGVSAVTGSPLLNIADFNNAPRLYSESQFIGGVYIPVEMISDEVALLPQDTNEPNTALRFEAEARFDFLDNPAVAIPPDAAALRFLDYITFDSAFSDGSVNDGAPIQNKLAVPGRININTASFPVLEAMIGSIDFNTSGQTPQALAADIDSYRLRTGAFSSTPNMGFQSKAELLEALNSVASSPLTIGQRDNATGFAELYNMATVRSDTFICYTYIQALRLNEAWVQNLPYSGGLTYSPTDWYNATQGIPLGQVGSIYNAQSVQSGGTTLYPEFILEGQKRFVALIDRTNATTNGAGATSANPADPQVVSLQGLPQ